MSNGPLRLRTLNILLRQNINIAKNSSRNLVYKSTTTNMAQSETMRLNPTSSTYSESARGQ